MTNIIKFIQHYLEQNNYLKNVFILMFGSGLSQLIPLLASLILGRLYTSEEFGVFILFSSLVSFLAVPATLRYEVAIMIPKKNNDAFHLVLLALAISFISSSILFIITLIYPISLSELLSSPNIRPWLIYLGASVFLISSIQILSVWFNRRKHYKTISTMMITQSGGSATVNIIDGFMGKTSGGLIPGSLAGQLLASGILFPKFIRQTKRLFPFFSWQQLKRNAITYSEYPKYNFPHRMVDMISITGLPLLITYFFSEAVLGSYGFMLRVLKAPLGILSSSLGQVYFQQISDSVVSKKTILPLFKKTLFHVGLLALPFFIIILFWGPDIFAFIFGPRWYIAGTYAQYLSPWLFVSTLSSPVSQTPLSLGYVKLNMWIGIANNLLLISLFFGFSYLYAEAETVFKFMGYILPFSYLFLLYWYYHIIKKYEHTIKNKQGLR